MIRQGVGTAAPVLAVLLLAAGAAHAQVRLDSGSDWGGVGLLETRNARMRPDGSLEGGVAYRRQRTFWFLNFQPLPFLETSFRFAQRLDGNSGNQDSTDRSFDIKLRLWDESEYLPAFVVGLQDFVGTGIYSGEYIALSKRWDDFDFFFIHYKKTDAAGEDGNFDAKYHALQEFDSKTAELISLGADVLMIGGDHSTPSSMAAHSWHPVPFLIQSNFCRMGHAEGFNEQQALRGTLGTFPAVDVMPLAMAHAGRFEKYGA